MQTLIALALLLSQLAPIRGYTTVDDTGVTLATPDGRYAVELGQGCDGMNVDENVDVYGGSGGIVTLAPADTDAQCSAFVSRSLSDVPCAVDAAGACDVENE